MTILKISQRMRKHIYVIMQLWMQRAVYELRILRSDYVLMEWLTFCITCLVYKFNDIRILISSRGHHVRGHS